MNIQQQNIVTAYIKGGDEVKRALSLIFPSIDFKNLSKDERPVKERIKTFDDAMLALGEEHPFVVEWKALNSCTPDLEAYLQLRVIVAALNEGWEPQYTEDEYRWWPWFYFYTADELAEKSDEWKRDHCLRTLGEKPSGYAGFAYANSRNAPSYTPAYIGSRLCLKSEALADYCAKQFIDLWKDFYYLSESDGKEASYE